MGLMYKIRRDNTKAKRGLHLTWKFQSKTIQIIKENLLRIQELRRCHMSDILSRKFKLN